MDPSLNPLDDLKKHDGTLLTKKTKFIEGIHAIIQFMTQLGIPIL